MIEDFLSCATLVTEELTYNGDEDGNLKILQNNSFIVMTPNQCLDLRELWKVEFSTLTFRYIYIYGVGLKIMLDRNELSFNDEVVKVFEYLQIECWNPDYHFLTDKVNDEDYGWVYKSERVEDEFILFLNIIYSTSNNGLSGVIETDMRVDYLSS